MTLFFYTIFAWIAWLIALPILAIAAFFSSKARAFFFLRMFPFGNPPFVEKGVWIHCASFGEVRAIKPIAEIVLRAGKRLNISVTTAAGHDEAHRLYPSAAVRYLPFENFLPFWATRQEALIVFDAELWFALFAVAKLRGAKTTLFNARIPAKSLPRYERLRFLYKLIFSQIDSIYAQSDADRDRLVSLGARKVEVLGNVKLLQIPERTRDFAKPQGLSIVLGSSHEGEEIAVLDAWEKSEIGGRIFVVPRHADRFESVWGEIEEFAAKRGLTCARLGGKKTLGQAQITLIDAMGALIDLYAIADLVVLGGSFSPKGGHNPIEPAHFGCRIVTGEHIFHQKALFAEINGAIFSSIDRLPQAMKTALESPPPILKGAIDPAQFERAVLSAID